MIELQNIGKQFNKQVVFEKLNIQLTNARSCISAPNGYGKSTLLCMLAGVIKPDIRWLLTSGIIGLVRFI